MFLFIVLSDKHICQVWTCGRGSDTLYLADWVLRGSERMVRAAAVAVNDFNALAMEDDALVLGS